jgi:hypothetical protein
MPLFARIRLDRRDLANDDGYAVRAHALVVVGMLIRPRFLADRDSAWLPGAR